MSNPVEDFFTAYTEAVRATDSAALLELYDDDVLVFDAWDRFEVVGIEAWSVSVGEWFSSLDGGHDEVSFADVRSFVADDLASGSAAVTFAAVAADGSSPHSMTNRLTVVLRRRDDGRWAVVHEHTSVPVDLESGSAIISA